MRAEAGEHRAGPRAGVAGRAAEHGAGTVRYGPMRVLRDARRAAHGRYGATGSTTTVPAYAPATASPVLSDGLRWYQVLLCCIARLQDRADEGERVVPLPREDEVVTEGLPKCEAS
eukprot:207010-Rhodomonas_salina.1